ncbi:MAG: LysR family transcriptional regulator [Opitutae bacterium]|nr:LysR family transcriptional regulator [Opitutae bacterium]
MELRHLRTFLVAAETLSISAAARRLNVTQPALSRQIRELEREVGHSLFVRHPAGLRLTATGRALRERGAPALAKMEAALSFAQGEAVREPAVLRVGYYGTMVIWSRVLAPALEKRTRRQPETTYAVQELTNAQMIVALRDGALDVAVLGPGDLPNAPGVTIETACEFPVSVLVALDHPLAKKRQLSLDELRDQEIISLSPESAPGRDRALIAACRAADFTPRIFSAGATFQEALLLGAQRGAVGLAGTFGAGIRSNLFPGLACIPLKPPGVLLPLHVAHVAHMESARLLAETIGTEARRAATAPRE